MTRPSMGLYECMPVIESIAPNTNARNSHQRTMYDFCYDIRKARVFYHD